MFIPVGVEGTFRYRPWGTAVVALANVGAALWFGLLEPSFPVFRASPVLESLIHDYGDVNPWTWITSAFVHADELHLVGNMVFLVPFAIVVEG